MFKGIKETFIGHFKQSFGESGAVLIHFRVFVPLPKLKIINFLDNSACFYKNMVDAQSKTIEILFN